MPKGTDIEVDTSTPGRTLPGKWRTKQRPGTVIRRADGRRDWRATLEIEGKNFVGKVAGEK